MFKISSLFLNMENKVNLVNHILRHTYIQIFKPILFSIILILAPEHFPVITLFQHNLAEEEPERAALMAERLMELGATVVIKCLCSILFCTI